MRTWSLAHRLFVGQLALILCLSGGISWALYIQAERHTHEESAARMLSVAGTVAANPLVLEALASPGPSARLQPYAAAVMDTAGVDFVTIMSPDGIRLTHRDPEQIGGRYLGSVDRALRGEAQTETYAGTLGPSVRAIVPVLDDGGQVAAMVSAGLTVNRVSIARNAQLPTVFGITLAALAAGTVVSWLLSRYLRRTTQGLEPRELLHMFAFYDSALHSVREGLLLISTKGELVLYNDQAAALLDLPPGQAGSRRDARTLGLPAPFAELLHSGRRAEDELHFSRDRILVVNQSPAVPAAHGHRSRTQAPAVGHQAAGPRRKLRRSPAERFGTVTTLRDHTEIGALTGELQSMRTLTDALQAQAHEHANRLHTVVSLIELDRPAEALDFATRDLEQSQLLADEVLAAVDEPALAALLMGKTAQARERGIRLEITADSAGFTGRGTVLPDPGELVTITGNLLDNAFDAVQAATDPVVTAGFSSTPAGFEIRIGDNGAGIPAADAGRIFDQGFSTKASSSALPAVSGASGRGIGLALVRQAVLRLGGTLQLDPGGGAPGRGATFTAVLPQVMAVGAVPAPAPVPAQASAPAPGARA